MTTAESLEIIEAVNSGKIFDLPKSKLQQFAIWLGSSDAHTHYGVAELAGYRNTIETALQNRILEETLSAGNTANNKTNNKPPNSKEDKDWYQRPIGIIGMTIFAGMILAFAIYVLKKHLGIPL